MPEDKRMHGLACILSSPQEEREWHPSQLLGTAPGPHSPREMCGANWYGCGGYWCNQLGMITSPRNSFLSCPISHRKGPANIPRWDTGKSCPLPAFIHLFQPTPASSLPRKAKHAAQRSPEIFGHVARELAALSEL